MAGERQRDEVEVHLEAAELCPPRRVGVLAREQVRESRLLSLSGASYLDLALLIQDHGAPGAIGADLEQLFRRVVFNVMAGNRDDHLRNHACLRAPGGWRLAPAYDMNPNVEKAEHALALDARQSFPDLAVAAATAPFYRLESGQAQRIIQELHEAVSGWRRRARAIELPVSEIALVAPAFAHAERGAL